MFYNRTSSTKNKYEGGVKSFRASRYNIFLVFCITISDYSLYKNSEFDCSVSIRLRAYTEQDASVAI